MMAIVDLIDPEGLEAGADQMINKAKKQLNQL